jgi:ABC-type transport system involved in multi-copper enzyme maturation permease subunit
MTANLQLLPVKEKPTFRGFSNLFRKESRAWWSTKRWWINALIWPILLCGLLANILFVPTIANLASEADIARAGSVDAHILSLGMSVFFELGVTALAIGTVIMAQDLIIAERRNGVAEWLLSKPIARRAFVLAKLLANIIPMLVIMIGPPALISYAMLSFRTGSPLPASSFTAGIGIMILHTLFYLCLTMVLGILCNNRGPVLAIALGSVLGGNLLAGMIKPLLYITPWILPKYASLIASGQAVPSSLGSAPIIATAVEVVVFLLIGLAIFEKSEY